MQKGISTEEFEQSRQSHQKNQKSQSHQKTKRGLNEQCNCGSKKKYKKCCYGRSVAEIRENQRIAQHNAFTYGHEMENEKLKIIRDWLKSIPRYEKIPYEVIDPPLDDGEELDKTKELNVIDITNFLTPFNYQAIQMKHYFAEYGYTVIAAHRANYSELVFMTRSQKPADIILMFRGVYLIFDFQHFELMKPKIQQMIDLRLKIEFPKSQ